MEPNSILIDQIVVMESAYGEGKLWLNVSKRQWKLKTQWLPFRPSWSIKSHSVLYSGPVSSLKFPNPEARG